MTIHGEKRRRGRNKAKEAVPSDTLLIQLDDESPTWYQYGKQIAGRNDTLADHPLPKKRKHQKDLVDKFRASADELYRQQVQLFSAGGKSSDDRWVDATMKSGTLKDRIAAMSVSLGEDPIHKLYALDGLLQMAGCGQKDANSRVAHMAAEALEDLFLTRFLPMSRKLVTLEQRPLHLYEGSRSLSPRVLLLWRFEEMVKEKYRSFISGYLATTLRSGMDVDKVFAVRTAAALLRSAPESEAALLQLIVDKIGDPSKKVAAAAGHELRKVLDQHPVMKTVIAREVQQLVHRPHLSPRALYNCVAFLNQLKLEREQGENPLAASLISTYFRLFEVAIKDKTKDSEEESVMRGRLLSALLTGVNRAHPYLPDSDAAMESHVDALYRVVHTATPSACTQALLLLFHLAVGSKMEERDDASDGGEESAKRQERFYRALYSTLSNPALLGSGKHLTMFFNLLYKAMKYDTETARVLAFVKRILSISVHCSAPVVAASLFLVNEIGKHHPVVAECVATRLHGPDATRVLDPTKREPRGALVSKDEVAPGADAKAPLWELALSAHHFHPSVVKFTRDLGSIDYAGDPLKDFTLSNFLDKFAYRNPKSAARVAEKFKNASSVAQRRSGTNSMIEQQFAPPVNDPSFLKRPSAAEDEFFRKFFVERTRRDEMKGIVRKGPAKGDNSKNDAAEIAALDAAEEFDDQKVGEFEWETDEEEEAFVDSLAQKIIEDSVNIHGPAELDDEDPDMGHWGDLDDASIEDDLEEAEWTEKVEAPSDDSDDEAPKLVKINDSEDDEDAFMDNKEGDDSSDSDDGGLFDGEDDVNIFNRSKPDAAGHEADEESFRSNDSNDLALLGGSADEEDVDEDEPEQESDDEEEEEPKKKRKRDVRTFALLQDYEEMINQSWSKMKRPNSKVTQEEGNDSDESEQEQFEPKKKKRKKKKRKGSD